MEVNNHEGLENGQEWIINDHKWTEMTMNQGTTKKGLEMDMNDQERIQMSMNGGERPRKDWKMDINVYYERPQTDLNVYYELPQTDPNEHERS